MKYRRYEVKMYDGYIYVAVEAENTPKKETIEYQLKKARNNNFIHFKTYEGFKRSRHLFESEDEKPKLDVNNLITVFAQSRWLDSVELIPCKECENRGSEN